MEATFSLLPPHFSLPGSLPGRGPRPPPFFIFTSTKTNRDDLRSSNLPYLDSLIGHNDAPFLEQHVDGALRVKCDETVWSLAVGLMLPRSLKLCHMSVLVKMPHYLFLCDGVVAEFSHIDLMDPVPFTHSMIFIRTAVAAVVRAPPLPASRSGGTRPRRSLSAFFRPEPLRSRPLVLGDLSGYVCCSMEQFNTSCRMYLRLVSLAMT